MKELTIEITSQCNMSCPWCSSDAGQHGHHVSVSTIKEWLVECPIVYDVIRISGGEPTLHPDIDEIIEICSEAGTVILMTNGTICYKHPLIYHYMVSYLGMNKDKIRWLVDSVGRSNVTVSAIIGTGYVDGAAKIALDLGIQLHLYRLQYQGRAKDRPHLDLYVTGQNGCNRMDKVTYTHDGNLIQCSSEKCGLTCDICNEE